MDSIELIWNPLYLRLMLRRRPKAIEASPKFVWPALYPFWLFNYGRAGEKGLHFNKKYSINI